MGAESSVQKHALKTKLFHAGLAVTVVLQLVTSLVMQGPGRDRAGDWLFQIHQYSGLTAFWFAFGFWLVLAFRRHGTETALLFPWFSLAGLGAVWNDLEGHARAAKSLRLPVYDDRGPLASAVHGLGLLLMTAMVVTGSVYYLSSLAGVQTSSVVRLVLEIHKTLANLVWAYVIGHAALAVLHHYLQNLDLGEMWSFRSRKISKGTPT